MDPDFWHRKWAVKDIAFHGRAPNPLLVQHFGALSPRAGARVFVPLCGKSLDIHWLLAQGFQVAGAELSRLAVDELFAELGLTPTVTQHGALSRLSGPNIDIYVGDIFALDAALLGSVDAVYDRAALVALPADMRQRYAAHLLKLTAHAPQLLVCFDYDQSALAGPPFAVPADEVAALYGATHALSLLDSPPVAGGLKGQCPALETVWWLAPT